MYSYRYADIEEIFIKRMRFHQYLVGRNLFLMQGYLGLNTELLADVAVKHDVSKFEHPERIGYIWMTWKFYCEKNNINFNFSPSIKDEMTDSHFHHITHNAHHPESHQNLDNMTDLNVIEMVCDWTAMSQELNIHQGSCMPWTLENIDKKWSFSKNKKKIIFLTIQELDKRNVVFSGE